MGTAVQPKLIMFIMNRLKFLLAAFVITVLTLGIYSCQKDTENEIASLNIIETRSSLSGQEYFKGIFFGIGNFGDKLKYHSQVNETYHGLDENLKIEINQKIDAMIVQIQDQNSNFFEKFRTEIDSKDPIRVRDAIGNGSKLIYEYINILYPNTKKAIDDVAEKIDQTCITDSGTLDFEKLNEVTNNHDEILSNNILSSNEDNPQAAFAVVWFFYAAAAAHNTIGVTANVAVVGAAAVYLAVKFWGPSLDNWGRTYDSSDTLELEMLISEIVEIK